jgi:hypothetical protein
MTGPVTTRPRESGDGLTFRDYGHYLYSGSFTDERGFYFILEPPTPPPEQPSMEAIRAAHAPPPFRPQSIRIDNNVSDGNAAYRNARDADVAAPNPRDPNFVEPDLADPNTALGKFQRSMVMDYQKWHDGDGYDLDALAAATPAERAVIEAILLHRGLKDWRDVEALAALKTPAAENALKAAMQHPDPQIRLAIVRNAPELVPEAGRTASLVKAIETASLYGGLSQALDEAAEFHPTEVVEALFRGVLHRDGETAVQFAALLMFLHGKADSPFDWDQRPFFLRFNTQNLQERVAAFAELCGKIGVDSSRYS